jgi:adhesin HecA-like repeat protein
MVGVGGIAMRGLVRPTYALLTLVAAVVGVTGVAHATVPAYGGCDTWVAPAGGDWANAAMWSAGVPDSLVDVCITLPGAYTVTLEANANVHSLTVGALSAAQPTLLLAAHTGTYVDLVVDGVLTNSGTVETSGNTGIDAAVHNTGTIYIGAATGTSWDEPEREWTNNGSFVVGPDGWFDIGNATRFVDAVGGTVTVSPTGNFAVQDGTFVLDGGTETGKPIGIAGDSPGTIIDNSDGPAAFEFDEYGDFYGNLAAGQTLSAYGGACCETGVGMGANVTNAGLITITGEYRSSAALVFGSLVNTGRIVLYDTSQYSLAGLYGELTNEGSIDVETRYAAFSGGPFLGTPSRLTNRGTIYGSGRLTATNADIDNQRGTISANLVVRKGIFHERAGRTYRSVRLAASILDLEGTGASSFTFTSSGELVGNVAPKQQITIAGRGTSFVHAYAGLTNAGSITLATTGAAGRAGLVWNSRLTNTGTITSGSSSVGYNGGVGVLRGQGILNEGTVRIMMPTEATSLSNVGTLHIAAGRTLTIPNGSFYQVYFATLAIGVRGTHAGRIVAGQDAEVAGTLAMTGTPAPGATYTVVGPTAHLYYTFNTVTPARFIAKYTPTEVDVTAS